MPEIQQRPAHCVNHVRGAAVSYIKFGLFLGTAHIDNGSTAKAITTVDSIAPFFTSYSPYLR